MINTTQNKLNRPNLPTHQHIIMPSPNPPQVMHEFYWIRAFKHFSQPIPTIICKKRRKERTLKSYLKLHRVRAITQAMDNVLRWMWATSTSRTISNLTMKAMSIWRHDSMQGEPEEFFTTSKYQASIWLYIIPYRTCNRELSQTYVVALE